MPLARRRQGARPHAGALPGEVRLIGGLWKRTKLPVADAPGLRPTPERVRQTLFNWLGQDLAGWRVLDAFAGSGALGFEAASRGAAEVVLLERDASLASALDSARARLAAGNVRVVGDDALSWMALMARSAPACFDLVLLDPPFAEPALGERAVALAAPLVAPRGFLYVEAGELPSALPAGFESWRTLRAGAVHVHLMRRAG